MSSPAEHAAAAAQPSFLDAFEAVSDAVESGAGLPSVTRAAARALEASVVVIDASSSVLAVACQSPEDERALLDGKDGSLSLELRVADAAVGRMAYRPRGGEPAAALVRMVATLIGLEVERARAPGRATEAAVGDFLSDLFSRRVTDRENILARASELGCDLSDGAAVLLVRARPHHAEEGDWRLRLLTLAERGARAVERSTLAASIELGPPPARAHVADGEPRTVHPARELVLLVPGHGAKPAALAAAAVRKELELGLGGAAVTVALSRPAADAADLHRAGAEALMAANVAQARGAVQLAFDETGAYRLLLPAMSEDPGELQRFHEETVAPLLAYDTQYETELLRTLETFLDADGNVARTAERLFTHRHTIRYRLDRVKELSGLDVGSSDGRERLSLGLKSMRVLGIGPPGGPASEAGAGAGRVPREEKDRGGA